MLHCETVEAELTFWWTLLSEKIWVGCSGMTDTKSGKYRTADKLR